MTHNIGDPDHIGVHNRLASDIQAQADAYEVDVTLPPQRNLGDRQHVDDHNLLAAALEAISEAEPPSKPSLPGVGGWATVTGVTGTYTQPRYEYADANGVEWVAYEWTGDGSVTTSGGLVDALVVGPGGHGHPNALEPGSGGAVHRGLTWLQGPNDIVVTSGGTLQDSSYGTRLGNLTAESGWQNSDRGSVAFPVQQDGLKSSITGSEIEYAQGGSRVATTYGSGGLRSRDGKQAVIVVCVPKEYAQNVQETFHGWDSFALVADGVVAEVKRVPDNEPHTLGAEWVPCDPDVQPGWDCIDGDFTPPPAPTREELLEALQEQIKETANE